MNVVNNMWKIIFMTILLMSPLVRAGFKKCCPVGQVLNLHTKNCINDSSEAFNKFSVNVEYVSETTSVKEEFAYEAVPNNEQYECTQSLRYQFELTLARVQTLYFIVDVHQPKYFSTSEVCLDHALDRKTSDISLVAQACLTCTQEEPCVNYCCPVGQISKDGKCENYSSVNILPEKKNKEVSIRLHCDKPVVYPRNLWDLNLKGEMSVDGSIHNTSEYCIQHEARNKASLLLCSMEEDPVDYKRVIKMVFMCLSMASIIVIVVFHVIIEDLWLNHFTKLKIPFFVFLLLSYLVIVITNLVDFSGTSSCVLVALALQYFSLGIFFWLTSMSLDIWLAFRIIANPSQNPDKKEAQQQSKMKCYYVLSFVCPMIVSIVTGIMQLAFDQEESTFVHPSIGVSCMIGQYLPRFFYFHMIILILLCINAVFYLLTVFKFTCGIWKEDKFGKCQMRNLRVFLELFFIMGINWISESVSFFIGWKFKENWDHPLIVFINSINWIIGVLILLIFCSKSTNRNLVRNLFCQDREDLEYYNLARTFSTQLSDKEETFRVMETQ